jgi:hypothetical protein
MKIIINNSDYIGATSSGLCLLHCLATPFLFLSQPALLSVSQELTFFWYILNYIFLAVSFIAVYYSVKNSSNLFIKVLLYLFWISLSLLILNEEFMILSIPELYTYISAIGLSVLHVYNLKYCRCDNEECCTS